MAWYNHEHRHSALKFVTPAQRHAGQAEELLRKRVKATIRKAADGTPMIFHGKGTVEIGRSEQDPLYKLPVRKVLGAIYLELGTIEQPAGEVLKRYTVGK